MAPCTRTVLHKTSEMEVIAFTLPKGTIIPLHDHPGKTIFQYMKKGKCRVKSYDFVEHPEYNFVVKAVSDDILSAGDHAMILPAGKNIHSVEILEDAEFIDVYTPACECDLNWYTLSELPEEGLFITTEIASSEVNLPFGRE